MKRFVVRGAWCVGVLLTLASGLAAQTNVRARMTARGLPRDLVTQVSRIAAEASAMGLPTDPLADKAIEGYAKHVPSDRIVSTVRAFAGRMREARTTIRGAGVRAPAGELVAAAAEAMGRGIGTAGIAAMVRAAPEESVAAPGLLVAAALTGQGLGPEQAVEVVTSAIRAGHDVPEILDLPSTARALQARGLTPTEIGGELLRSPGRPVDAGQSGNALMARPVQTPTRSNRP